MAFKANVDTGSYLRTPNEFESTSHIYVHMVLNFEPKSLFLLKSASDHKRGIVYAYEVENYSKLFVRFNDWQYTILMISNVQF